MRSPSVLAGALLLVACGGGSTADDGGPPIENNFRIDCLGMYVSNTNQGGTVIPLLGDDLTLQEDAVANENPYTERCSFWVTGPFEPGPLSIKNDASNLSDPKTGTFFMSYLGGQWVMRSGEIVLEDEPSPFRANGRYDGLFRGPGGQTARIQGLFEWCEPSFEDCPYKIDVDFPYEFQVSTAIGDSWGQATECRVLIDRTSGGMQVDMQIGSWRGVNVSQYWNKQCSNRSASMGPLDNANRLTFRAGGVTGAGRYGPFVTTDFGNDVLLPHLGWELPSNFWQHIYLESDAQYCRLGRMGGGLATQSTGTNALGDPVGGPSICEWEVTEGSPGRFDLSCSRVIPTYQGDFFFTTRMNFGEFHLTSACDVRFK